MENLFFILPALLVGVFIYITYEMYKMSTEKSS